MKRLFVAFIIIFCFQTISVSAEKAVVRGNLAGTLTPARSIENNAAREAVFHLFELLAVEYPESQIAQTVELLVTVPRPFLRYRDSFSLSVFGNLSRPLTEGVQQVEGSLLFQKQLPPSGRIMLRLPLTEDPVSSGPGVLLPSTIFTAGQFPLVIQITPIMKGLPSDLMNADIAVSADIILQDIGFLDIELLLPEADNQERKRILSAAEIMLDGNKQDQSILKETTKLDSGVYRFNMTIPGFTGENRTFTIRQGEVTVLRLSPQPVESRYTIQAPEEAMVFLNGEPVDLINRRTGLIAPGEHVFLFRIGDYQLSRRIVVEAGKSYNIELLLDINVDSR
jgi:hypothetical protein